MVKQLHCCKPNPHGLECCFHITAFTDTKEEPETMTETCCWCGKEKTSRHGNKLPETFRSMEAFKNKFYPNEVRSKKIEE